MIGTLTVAQAAFFASYIFTSALWLWSLFLWRSRRVTLSEECVELLSEAKDGKKVAIEVVVNDKDHSMDGGDGGAPPLGWWQYMMHSGALQCLQLNTDALVQSKDTLQAMVEFGSILLWFFICDRTNFFRQSDKEYSRDLFLFIFVVLIIVCFGTSVQKVRTPLLLNRPQTEEWKGWMQVLFLLYHYYEAKEAYNAIRIFIAGYVWLTGYGNFSYYYKTKDFGIGRFCQMMWRLNFLVFFCCIVLNNSYMLYYICPMHTIFTILVYASLGLASHLNSSTLWIWVKFGLCFLVVFLTWDIKSIFYTLWGPLEWLVGYLDPRKLNVTDGIHEWYFRSSLDRYVWVYGMMVAMVAPHVSTMFQRIDNCGVTLRTALRTLLLAVVGAVGAIWYQYVYTLPKVEYNKVHPYTSWIPLTLWILVRNLTPTLRLYNLRLLGWLGCITLETYLCQFHIWLHSDIANGQPKYLLTIIPGYPLLNFALCTALYVYIAHRLFELTNQLKNVAIPHDDNRLLLRNILIMWWLGAAVYGIVYIMMHTFVYE